MTLKVLISHAMAGYPKDALVTVVSPTTGEPVTGCEPKRISDGESAEFYVHSGAQLKVDEIDALPKEAVAPEAEAVIPPTDPDAGPPPIDPV